MKFEKRFQTEVVPEWKIKYIDYKGLKKKLRNVQREKLTRDKEFMQNNNEPSINGDSEILSQHNEKRNSVQSFGMNSVADSVQDFIHKVSYALVTLQRHQSLSSYNKPRPSKITSLETLMDQVDPKERLFFTALDVELEKIEHFYKLQEIKTTNRMNLLAQQYEKLKEMSDTKKQSFEVRNTKAFVKQSIDYFMSPNKPGSTSTISSDTDEQQIYYKIAKKIIKKAVFEFYRGAELLKKYRVLNYNGFSKILKKYDKITERNGSQIYMQKVTNSYFVKSDVIKKLLKEAEDFYVENFEGGSRSQAIQKLRMPNKDNKTYYHSMLRVGLYLGLALPALIRAIMEAMAIEKENAIWPKLIELYSGFLLAVAFLLLFSVNMYIWTMSHINYKFIFEFDTRSNLDFRQYIEIPAIIFLILCYVMFFNFHFQENTFIDPSKYPIILIIIIVAILFNPLRTLYYNARRWFIFTATRLIGSGILRVEFRDFFFADILVSLSYSMTTLRLFGCLESKCSDKLIPALGSIPAIFRVLQTCKRCWDTLQVNHFINLGKYGSTIFAIVMSYRYRIASTSINRALWVIVQSISSIYSFIWDVKMDWSLFKLHSTNYLLRDELGFEHHWLYYCAIIINFILRMSWTLLLINNENFSREAASFIVASSEMIRRIQWCIIRVENEHVNNCVQFRAIKEVPLPFPTEESENIEVAIAADYDRASSLASFSSWSRKLFSRRKLNPADNWRDFEPTKNTSEYMYVNEIYEESDDDDDSYDEENDYDKYRERNTMVSLARMEGGHGLSNAYASRSFLPLNENNRSIY
ncbi:EXS family protein [Rhizophagus clarus]|uniref:EXS family protein n=1 Tax=Rhizophagus clarus TaxID=94130 RepID=A0A8H3M470_9GLOM|nr:EXS family protein [Rhizophagus clarus]